MLSSFSGKRVLVTGADGFIGSHLVERLVHLGASVTAYTFYNSWNHIGWLSQLDNYSLKEINIQRGDIRDAERVKSVMNKAEYVLHLSSLIAIPYSYVAGRSYVETNISGALNVLEAAKTTDSLIRLVHVSTSEVYGTAQTVPISEDHPLVGQSPYSASKIGADKLAESYQRSFDLPVVTARPFNTYGPRQTARAVIPTIISQMLGSPEVLKLGSLEPTRDFNYVTDTVNGMLALALCKKAEGEVVNISTNQEWSIAQTADMIMGIIGQSVPIESDMKRIRPEKSEVDRLLGDNSKIMTLTDWKPKVSFEEGLKKTIDWIRDHQSLFDPKSYEI